MTNHRTKISVNTDSYLFDIIDKYSIDKPKHFLMMYNTEEKSIGFKFEQAFLQSLASYLRKKGEMVTNLTKKSLIIETINQIIKQLGDVQLIVLFSGHGHGNMLRISNKIVKKKYIRFDASKFPSDTILFTSSCRPFTKNMKFYPKAEKRVDITIVGESRGIIYPSNPNGLYGVYQHLNETVNSIQNCFFKIKSY